MIAVSLGIAGEAAAAMLTSLFPEGVPGFDLTPGVTVQSRLRPDFTPLGLRAGGFQVLPTLDESLGYDSQPLPSASHGGSWEVTTAPALQVKSDWSRDAVGAAVRLQDTRYLSLPNQSHTDGSAEVGGRIDIDDDQFAVALSHLSGHEDRGQIDALDSDRPISFQIDEFRSSYLAVDGRWSAVPSLEFSNWTYGNTTILGIPADQSYRDRIVGQGEMTLRYEWAPLRNILVVIRALDQDYTQTPPGQASSDSRSFQLLGGFDYDDDSVWRWRLLIGGEVRQFSASVYPARDTLITEAEATWSPSGMTTLRASIDRDTEDAAQEGVAGFTYLAGRLTVDHEYSRNLLLKGSAGLERADYFQGGRQSGYTLGLGATWLIDRSMQLSAAYDFSDLRGGQVAGQALASGSSRSVAVITLHLAL